MNPYQVVKDFEAALCEFTGAPYCVTTTSCTMALLIACRWHAEQIDHIDTVVEIPRRTYVGVPMSIKHAGFDVKFRDEDWIGNYQLDPLPVWDSARWFLANMYRDGQMVCLSFHWSKHLAIGQGGAILHDNPEFDEWARMMRFDGRREGVAPSKQEGWVLGYHAYMSPSAAAEGLSRLALLPRHNPPLPNDDYPDLSQLEIFKQW